MENQRTVDSIIAGMTNLVAKKIPIAPQQWLDGALYLHILSVEETTKLVELELEVARIKREFIDLGNSNADAKSRTEATDEYKAYRVQKNRVEFIENYILLAKKYSSVTTQLGG